MKTLIITVIGPDRPGLVEAIAETVSGHGGNWTESRMAHLAGQFAGMVQIEISDEAKAEELEKSLELLEGQGLSISVVPSDTVEATDDALALKRWVLSVIGQDRPGIVSQISRAIAKYGINVEELETDTESAPMSGELLFKAKIDLSVPADADLDGLRASLEAIAHDLMVEFSLSD